MTAASGKQSPLGINTLSGLLQNTGLNINQNFTTYVGSSANVDNYTSGTIVSSTLLAKITQAKQLAFAKLGTNPTSEVNVSVYTNLVNCGSSLIPALANTDPTSYNPTNTATSTDGTTEIITCTSTVNFLVNNPVIFSGTSFGGITAGTIYYVKTIVSTTEFTVSTTPGGSTHNLSTATGSLTIFNAAFYENGFLAKIALQAYNEFNYNGSTSYSDFLQSFLTCYSYMKQNNSTIATMSNAPAFMEGTYSNMNDLITSDVSGVNLALLDFGQDLINTGKAINLATMQDFGTPSNLLKTLQTNNAITRSVSLALLMADLSTSELGLILGNLAVPDAEQERKIYDAFKIIVGDDLKEVLVPLNVNTVGLETLADLLDVKKLFPKSWPSMTVPAYNVNGAPANSKIYYPIFAPSGGVNSQLTPQPVNVADCG